MDSTAFKTISVAVLVAAAFSSASHAALTGWWEFDGDFSDSSGRGHTATPHGDAQLGAGLYGGGLVLDGDGDWADVASSVDHQFAQREDFSITLFFSGPATGTNDGLVTKGYGNDPRDPAGYYLLQVTSSGSYEFDSRCCSGGTPRVRTGQIGPDITDGLWHNVTLVRDYGAGEIRSYIDGALESTIALNPTNGGDWNMGVNNEALTFGDHLNRFTAGSFDDIAIWKDEVLSADDISVISSGGVRALIPEPSSGVLVCIAGILAIARRRR